MLLLYYCNSLSINEKRRLTKYVSLKIWEVIEKGLCNIQVLTTLEAIGKRLFTCYVLISASQYSWSTFLALKPLLKCIHFIGDYSKFYAKSRFSCPNVLFCKMRQPFLNPGGFFLAFYTLFYDKNYIPPGWFWQRQFFTGFNETISIFCRFFLKPPGSFIET